MERQPAHDCDVKPGKYLDKLHHYWLMFWLASYIELTHVQVTVMKFLSKKEYHTKIMIVLSMLYLLLFALDRVTGNLSAIINNSSLT